MLSQTGIFRLLFSQFHCWGSRPEHCFFFSFFWCGTGGDHPPKRFSMRDNDPTEGLALMVKRFKKTVKTVKKTALCTQNLAKISLSLDTTWPLKPCSITVSGDLELWTPVVVVAPPQLRVKFLLEKMEGGSSIYAAFELGPDGRV